ncbi:protein HEAT INTOLERANT 4-like [Rosa sericea]
MKRKPLRELEVEIAAQPLRKRVKPPPTEYLKELAPERGGSMEGCVSGWDTEVRSGLTTLPLFKKSSRVYLFGSTEEAMVKREVVALIPVVVAVVSASPPSNELGLVLSEGKVEEIIPMKRLKIDWAPYVPLDKRVDKEGPEIFVLSCRQRRAALKHKHVKGSRDLLKFEYAVPYLDPAAQVMCHEVHVHEEEYFSANDDELEELYFSGEDEDQVIEEDEKNVKVEEEAKGENIELGVREGGRRRSVENMMKMRIYKFYPVQTPETPDISEFKNAFVNRYYGTAHEKLRIFCDD